MTDIKATPVNPPWKASYFLCGLTIATLLMGVLVVGSYYTALPEPRLPSNLGPLFAFWGFFTLIFSAIVYIARSR